MTTKRLLPPDAFEPVTGETPREDTHYLDRVLDGPILLRKVRGLPRPGLVTTKVPAGALGDFNRAILEARIKGLEAKVLAEDPEFRRQRLPELPK